MEVLVKVLNQYTNEFPEDMLLEIQLLKICGHMEDKGVPTITWIGDIIGCMGMLVWMLRSLGYLWGR